DLKSVGLSLQESSNPITTTSTSTPASTADRASSPEPALHGRRLGFIESDGVAEFGAA
ncbi:hypothetical protein CCACVL1_24253, partial [Corchorus capsularis]